MDAQSIFKGSREILKSAGLYIRNAVTDDVLYVTSNARPSDLVEVAAFNVSIRAGGLKSHIASPDYSYAVIGPSGEPCCVFGVSKSKFVYSDTKARVVWLLGTPELDSVLRDNPKTIIRAARLVARRLTKNCGRIGNVIPTALLPARSGFLTKLGAYWYEGLGFYAFFLEAKRVPRP